MPITAKYLKDKKDKKEKKEKEKKKRVKKEVVKQKQKQSQSVVVNVVAPVRRRRTKPKLVVPQRPTFIQSFQPQPQFNVPTIDQLVSQGQGQTLGGRVREEPLRTLPIAIARPIPFNEDPLVLRPMPFTDELLRKTDLQRQPVAKPVKAKPVKAKPIEPFMEMGGRRVGRPSLNRTEEEKKLAAIEASKRFRDRKRREREEDAIREAPNMIERRNLIDDEAITDLTNFMKKPY